MPFVLINEDTKEERRYGHEEDGAEVVIAARITEQGYVKSVRPVAGLNYDKGMRKQIKEILYYIFNLELEDGNVHYHLE